MVVVERPPEVQAGAVTPPALAIDGISHSYGPRQALADVSLSIPPATFVVLLGLNGAGKSTLFSLITRLFATQRGQIRIFGHDVARAPGAALRLLGVVFQLRTLDLDLSVVQNLTYHAALHGIGRRSALERARDLLARVELSDRAEDKIRKLSGGQIGLDIRARAGILSYVRSLVAEEGVSVLWATHLVDEVSEADTVSVLHHGRVLAHGPVQEVVAGARAKDIGSAFARLTESKGRPRSRTRWRTSNHEAA